MIGWVVAEVKHVGVQAHVPVDFIALGIVEKRICVGEAELSIVAVLGLDLATVEVYIRSFKRLRMVNPTKIGLSSMILIFSCNLLHSLFGGDQLDFIATSDNLSCLAKY